MERLEAFGGRGAWSEQRRRDGASRLLDDLGG